MKKSLIFATVIITLISFHSCEKYDDYYGDYEHTTTYFANTRMNRSVIIDEYDYIQVGAVLGGKIENTVDEWVKYEFVDSLVNQAGYDVLPSSLYETENDERNGESNVITIPKGSMLGMMKIKLKPEFFLDENTLEVNYALAFRIIDASSDSIGNDVTLVTFKYLSNAVGFYTHKGIAISTIDTLQYENTDIEFLTNGPAGTNSVKSKTLRLGFTNVSLNLSIDSENKVTLVNDEDSDIEILSTEYGFFDRENDHNIYLNYTYDKDGTIYEATDTLFFVKRVIDNVLQWDTRYF